MPKFLNIFSKKPVQKNKQLEITIDNREKNSLVVSELTNLGFKTKFKQLPVADYLINNTAIERKTISDFKSSIKNKRLHQQLLEIKQYPKHFLILEGLEQKDIYNSPGLHENALRGFILTTILEYNVPIIFTQNEKDTATYIHILAKKQNKTGTSIRPSKIILTEREQLQFILEGFPNIGPITAKKLLNHYKTLNKLSNTSLKELKKIIGKKAITLHKLLNTEY